MLGQIRYRERGRGGLIRTQVCGLPLLQAEVCPDGWRGNFQLRRAARRLVRAGVRRVLVPTDFPRWDLLGRYGLGPVDPLPFLRFYAGGLALARMEQDGLIPTACAVALRGTRVDRDMVRTAEFLCPCVRELAVSAPEGGAALADWLRWEAGMPVRPDGSGMDLAVCFAPEVQRAGERTLLLCPSRWELGGVRIRGTDLPEEFQEDLPILAALWETGKLGRAGLEIGVSHSEST